MIWHDAKITKPEPMQEVLVWVDGHRGPQWRNNHALVAYMDQQGKWHEERHYSKDPLVGVIAWSYIWEPHQHVFYDDQQ